MQNNRNIHTENPPLSAEDWELALEPYADNPGAALSLGSLFMILRSYLTTKPRQIEVAIEGLDQAMEILFPFTEFHEVSFVLFRRLADGKLTRDEEKLLETLGIRY